MVRAAAAILLALVLPEVSHAQRVLGPSEDATVVPRGVLRFGAQPTWGRANERFASGLSATARGTLEPLATGYDVDSLGPAQVELLRPLAGELRTITGLSNVPLSLGRLRVAFDASSVTTPLSLEYGLTNRITIGAMVPYIKTRTEVLLNPNPGRNEGTMGINPAFLASTAGAGARTQNGRVVTQLTEAATQLQSQLAACAGSTSPACAAINADRQRAAQLAATAAAVAASINKVYGSVAGMTSRFAPTGNSALQLAVEGRLATLSTDFLALLGMPATRASWIADRPVGAPLMGLADFNRVLTDSSFGIVAAPLETVERSHIGDVEAGIKVLLYDGFGGGVPQRITPGGIKLRLAVGALYRFGVGQYESADDFADIGTGDSQDDIEARVFADVLMGQRFWASVVARYGIQRSDAQFLRIPEGPNDAFPALYRKQVVTRDLGNYVMGEISPRYVLTDALSLGATYSFYRKGEDAYSGSYTTQNLEGTTVTLDASTMDAGSGRTEQRVMGGVTFSTMAAYYRGRSKLPLEVSYTVGQSVSGAGNTMKTFTQAIGLRVYARLFGGEDSRPTHIARPSAR
ncbi:MAG: hypothetical protein ABIZ91_14220 [Gemmatimonadaceae bacterium]